MSVMLLLAGSAISAEREIPVATILPSGTAAGAQTDRQIFEKVTSPFLREYCTDCHGAKKQKGKLRLDTLGGDLRAKSADLATWQRVLEQIECGDMPPADATPQPKREQAERIARWLRGELIAAGITLDGPGEMAFPGKGNYVNHDRLFNQPSTAAPATPARVWRLSPYAYRGFVSDLTNGQAYAVTPFGLTTDPGFRDYAFRYKVSGSETQQLALNAKEVLDAMLTKRKQKWTPPRALADIADAGTAPGAEQVRAAVAYFFQQVLGRDPNAEELPRFTGFVTNSIAKLGNREGLIHGLTPVLLHPEAIFRTEFGTGTPDAHGRVMLSPKELAVAVAYALTDDRPDATLLAAAQGGRLVMPEDVRREVTRMLGDAQIGKPRILRFFQEYFEYYRAPEVFKDEHLLREAKLARDMGAYHPEVFVHDTDRLVEFFLAKDRDVLRELLTTDKSYVGADSIGHWLSFQKKREDEAKKKGTTPPTHPFSDKSAIHKHYTFDPANWSVEMPLALPAEQRAGILTQPSWLIAHSTNSDNHAIQRGKWIRERLLGGHIPDTPITVEAKLPDEPDQTLRHRMRVTREEYCFKCHAAMDPLGMPFEIYDHFGRFRTTELGKPVDASGEIIASGDAKLDGKVGNAIEMIRKLADSERVQQVFVRHAFRYWMGRNETLDDAPTLQAAYKSYRDNHGSMKALITSLLTSDSFLYRIKADPAALPIRQ